MTLGTAVVETSSLGDRTYLVHDGEVAVVVDPQRDIDRVLALAGRLGVRITHVAETHLHNDYVSGGLALARVTGAAYLVAAAERVRFARVPVADGDRIAVSDRLTLTAVATPGHTFHHLSYVVGHDGEVAGVCTGGSLLFGTTGRTDLLGADHARTLAHHQHASARRLADLLPDGTPVWPTHGFGSFCSATPPDADTSTIGREKRVNPVLRLHADAYVEHLLAGLGAYPAYYAHMGVRNAQGADLIDLTPARRADPAELRRRIDAGEWVVDLRSRKAYAYRHLAGTLSFGTDGPLATWLGWTLPHGTPLTLLGDSPQQVAAAQRELARIGIAGSAAAAAGTPDDWARGPADLAEGRRATFADLAASEPDAILDVRADAEWRAGHLAGAVHIPLPELTTRLTELGEGTIWVHCAAGYRAAAAASMLTRAGRRTVAVDDDWANAAAAGLPIV
ncbi:MBL fold metallo-hydrolase [Couchioplanes azureus]|uniref:MBL fold metallo-hydrolase n=1 Tax=Couchioplanes caeruleus TaxID=56438 RepID=UPI0016700E98|nr:MBL fold metallo-hydrolase [Couchioplanes caeruleus]GGQ60865.1 MBL fold metallo-hydrolase [Couchioplanes caeruleus subsp. azureus]